MSHGKSNFVFLAGYNRKLFEYASNAETRAGSDPKWALLLTRHFLEAIIEEIAKHKGVTLSADANSRPDLREKLRLLERAGAINKQTARDLHRIRINANQGAHHSSETPDPTYDDAINQLRAVYVIAIWFHREFNKKARFTAPSFRDPPLSGGRTTSSFSNVGQGSHSSRRQSREKSATSESAAARQRQSSRHDFVGSRSTLHTEKQVSSRIPARLIQVTAACLVGVAIYQVFPKTPVPETTVDAELLERVHTWDPKVPSVGDFLIKQAED